MQFSSAQLTKDTAINVLQEEKSTSQAPNSNMLWSMDINDQIKWKDVKMSRKHQP